MSDPARRPHPLRHTLDEIAERAEKAVHLHPGTHPGTRADRAVDEAVQRYARAEAAERDEKAEADRLVAEELARTAADVNLTLDLALRIGEVMLGSGAGASDVAATMLNVTFACGLRYCEVDVTYTTLQVVHQPSSDAETYTRIRNVRWRQVDFTILTAVDHTARDLVAGRIDRDEARSQVARATSVRRSLPRWAVTVGWGVMGGGVALIMGGSPLVALIAVLSAVLIDRAKYAMGRVQLPVFYQQTAGGLIATLLAIAVHLLKLPINSSFVIVSGIVVLLSGITYLGSVQDALSGYYVTAGARGLEATMQTAGIIAGVTAGLALGARLGVPIPFNATVTGLTSLPLMLIGGAITAAAYAFASYAPRRSWLPIAGVALLGSLVYLLLTDAHLGRPASSAVGAVLVGLLAYAVSGRVRVPPLIIVVTAIAPLLPGLAVFQGLSQMVAGRTVGLLSLVSAGSIVVALGAGVILGEYVAQPLRRTTGKVERRLSGPRLVGPLHRYGSRKAGAAKNG